MLEKQDKGILTGVPSEIDYPNFTSKYDELDMLRGDIAEAFDKIEDNRKKGTNPRFSFRIALYLTLVITVASFIKSAKGEVDSLNKDLTTGPSGSDIRSATVSIKLLRGILANNSELLDVSTNALPAFEIARFTFISVLFLFAMLIVCIMVVGTCKESVRVAQWYLSCL